MKKLFSATAALMTVGALTTGAHAANVSAGIQGGFFTDSEGNNLNGTLMIINDADQDGTFGNFNASTLLSDTFTPDSGDEVVATAPINNESAGTTPQFDAATGNALLWAFFDIPETSINPTQDDDQTDGLDLASGPLSANGGSAEFEFGTYRDDRGDGAFVVPSQGTIPMQRVTESAGGQTPNSGLQTQPVPEPTSLALLGGLAGVTLLGRRRRKA